MRDPAVARWAGMGSACSMLIVLSLLSICFSASVTVNAVEPQEQRLYSPYGDPLRPYGNIDFSQYHSLSQIENLSKDLAKNYSSIAEMVLLNKTHKGRDIYALKISDNPKSYERDEPILYFVGQHHAREWMGAEVVLYLADKLTSEYGTNATITNLVNNREIWLIPVLNADGRSYDSYGDAGNDATNYRDWRKNLRDNNKNGIIDGGDGVDLNRNYAYDFGGSGSSGNPNDLTYRGPYAFSEPETTDIRDLTYDHWFRASTSYHSYGQIIYYGPAASDAKMDQVSSTLGNRLESYITNNVGSNQNYYTVNSLGGSGQDGGWLLNLRRIQSFLIELYPAQGDSIPNPYNGFHPPEGKVLPECQDHIEAQLFLIRSAVNGFYDSNFQKDAGVWAIDPFRENHTYNDGLYTIDAAVENYGRGAQSGVGVQITITEDPSGANKVVYQNTKQTGNLALNQTEWLSWSYDFKNKSEYEVRVKTTLAGDELIWNDWRAVRFKVVLAPPTVVSTIPANGDTNVSVSTNVSVTFSKEMNKTATEGAFSISPTVSGVFTWPTDKEMVFDPSANLSYSTKYIVAISTAAKDLQGLNMQSPYVFDFNTTFPPDIIPPYVVATSPTEGAIGVMPTTNIIFTWSEDMNSSSAESAFSSNPSITCIWSWSGVNQKCTPSAVLKQQTQYTINLSTIAKDTSDNKMKNPFTLNFTTSHGDFPAPYVVMTTPKNNDTNVSLSNNITITFDQCMNKSGTEGAFSANPFIQGIFAWDMKSEAITIDPIWNLQANTTYSVTMSIAARSCSNVHMQDPYSFSFTTETNVVPSPPTILDTYPDDGATNTSLNTKISITFSKAMNKAVTQSAITASPSIPWTSSWLSGDTNITFTPTSYLVASTKYTITTTTAAKSADGANMAKTHAFSFTTAQPPDNTPPTVISTDPQDKAIDVNTTSKITIAFSKAMDKASVGSALSISPGSITNKTWSNDSTIVLTAGLEEGKSYTVTVSGGAKDLAGNHMAENYTFSFTTKKENPPQACPLCIDSSNFILLLLLIIVVVVVVAMILIALVIAKRKKKKESPEEPPKLEFK